MPNLHGITLTTEQVSTVLLVISWLLSLDRATLEKTEDQLVASLVGKTTT